MIIHSCSCQLEPARLLAKPVWHRRELYVYKVANACPPVSRRVAACRTAGVRVQAIDAAQPFDLEHKLQKRVAKDRLLKIGIVGFGKFGQFLGQRFARVGHAVIATSRGNYEEKAKELGVQFFADADDFCEEHPEVVILASSILSTANVLKALPVQRLKRNTLFVDVLSVKVFPKQLILTSLPPEIDLLCTHPMFGPDSGKGSWQGLNFMYDRVRVGSSRERQQRVEKFLQFFRDEGCRMVEMTCEEHDRQAASTQFITHTVGRVLGAMDLKPTDINTKGFDSLLNLVNNTANDSFDLYYGLFLYNQNATDELERLEDAFDLVKKQLFGRLHDIARNQLFPMPAMLEAEVLPQNLLTDGSSTIGSDNGNKQLVPPAIEAEAYSRPVGSPVDS